MEVVRMDEDTALKAATRKRVAGSIPAASANFNGNELNTGFVRLVC